MGLRLVLITRRFWPLVGGAEMVMANLASEFHRQGMAVRIVTAQWESQWPTEIVHHAVSVTRLPNPPQRAWGTFRYMISLGRWLRQQRPHIDLVYVSMLKHDAYTAVGACRRLGLPVVLRGEGAGETGDCHWHETGRFGRRIRQRCRAASAVIAPSDAIEAELLEAGFVRQRLRKIYNGVRVGPLPDTPDRLAARTALAEVNGDLRLAPQAPLVVYTGRLDLRKGVADLVAAWPSVARRWPQARLWLIGDGPDREQLFRQVSELDLRGKVLLPGTFDNVDEILQAADLFVLASYEEGMSVSLLEAMAAGLPIVASRIPGNEKLIEHERQGLLVPAGDRTALAAAMRRLLEDHALAARCGQAAYQRVKQHYSLETVAAKHLELFHELVEASSRRLGG